MARTIFDRNPDPVHLMDELYHQGTRDFKGLPLGDVEGHVRRRYTTCYGVLCLARMLTDLGRIETAMPLVVVGAQFQDKRSSKEFPAAHAIPCDLAIALPGHPAPGVHLYNFLLNPFNRTWAKLNMFGETDRVHRLVNVADRSCEAGLDGLASVLATACEEVIRNGLRARTLTPGKYATKPISASVQTEFELILVPGFVRAANARLQALERNLNYFERTEIAHRPLVDRIGRPVEARPSDTRLGSPNAQARAANLNTLRQVLKTYADQTLVDRPALFTIATKIEALRINERAY
jgi:hypothetical protein